MYLEHFPFSHTLPATPRFLAELEGGRLSSAKGALSSYTHSLPSLYSLREQRRVCDLDLHLVPRNTRRRKKDLRGEKCGEESKGIVAFWMKITEWRIFSSAEIWLFNSTC